MRTRIVVNESLSLERTAAGDRYVCACGHDLAPAEANFKDHCKVSERPTADIGPGYPSFAVEMAQQMCFREFFCPGCGSRLTTEVARVGDAYLWDIQLRL
jgi:N-methylhydantoinase B